MNNYRFNLRQLQKKVDLFKTFSNNKNWIKIVRSALGMTSSYLAHKLCISQASFAMLEKRETLGTITVNKLEAIAKAMDCKLVYAFVPNNSFEDIIEKQARKIAKDKIDSITNSIALELQQIDKNELKEQYEELVEELLSKNPKSLWRIE